MKWSLKREIFPFTILLIMACVSIYYYPSLPDKMPIHFDIKGNINGWADKNIFFLTQFGIMLGLYFLITFIPFIDPFRKKIESKYGLLLLFRDIIIGFFGFIFGIRILAAFEGSSRQDLLGVGLGLLLFLTGNYMPKLPRNWFFGIKTPWTLSSDVIWRKTHIVGGWLFALSGLTIIFLSFLKVSMDTTLFILLPVALVSGLIYPLYLFKKLQKTNEL
jgi:uncharacterized membrane protein